MYVLLELEQQTERERGERERERERERESLGRSRLSRFYSRDNLLLVPCASFAINEKERERERGREMLRSIAASIYSSLLVSYTLHSPSYSGKSLE